MALQDLLSSLFTKLHGWVETTIVMLPNLALALVIVAVAWFAARTVGRWVARGLQRMGHDAHDSQIPGLLGAVARIGILTAGLFVALGVLHLDKTVTSLLAGVGVIGLALGFAFQDMAANFIAGVMLAIKKPFVAGQVIQYGSEIGKVLQIDLRQTKLRRFTGEVVLVPNRKLLENELINVSEATARRVDLEVGVGYATDLEQAQRVALEALAGLEGVLTKDHETLALYTGFGGSSIDMKLCFWVDYGQRPDDFLRLKSEAIKAIKHAFERAGIEIPFPIRTLDIPRGALAEVVEADAA